LIRIGARKRNIELGIISIEVKLYGGIIGNVTKELSVQRKKQRAKDRSLGYAMKK